MHDSLKSLLEKEFEQRKRRNASYSLRAFARDLDISPSRLSEIMNAGAMPRADTARRLLVRLKIDAQIISQIIDNLESNANVGSNVQSILLPSRKWNDCKESLIKASQQFETNEKYICLFFQESVPSGLDLIVREHCERK